ncbi:MAG: ABC-F family ATP-binding cassette domain-containing protein, partial [Deltaproteobacteria bacterium]|nr:ABC-F family ATP-binding cassette domain-containing protein [Deltaproteobacteria bacterium]
VSQQLPSSVETVLKAITSINISSLEKELKELGFPEPSEIMHSNNFSYGEIRKLHLLLAKLISHDMLLLDEPTEDLDERGVEWLIDWILSWEKGLIVVSHDRLLLSHFKHFFIISESGCSYFSGSFNELSLLLEDQALDAEKQYIKQINMLDRKEEHRVKVTRRRRRKKNFGRISELERCTPKSRLNTKRGKAQVNQGKAARIEQDRISTERKRTLVSRRALSVNLPLELPDIKIDVLGNNTPVVLESISAKFDKGYLFKDIDLSIGYEKFAIVGSNGVGKTTLLNIIVGNTKPFSGKVSIDGNLGWISQGGANWMTDESLFARLMIYSGSQKTDEVTRVLLMHKFPIALAERPISSLSPGERVRAALICLFHQKPGIQILVLDEPTFSLDFVGETSLRKALKAWKGTLIVVSHNREFLKSIGVSKTLEPGRIN